jgi:hypothetical protein
MNSLDVAFHAFKISVVHKVVLVFIALHVWVLQSCTKMSRDVVLIDTTMCDPSPAAVSGFLGLTQPIKRTSNQPTIPQHLLFFTHELPWT